MKKSAIYIIVAVVAVNCLPLTPAKAAYTVKPKVGQCFNLTSQEVNEPYPKSNPTNCSKSHNAETYLVAKWPLTVPPEELSEGEGLEVAESLCKAWGKGGVLEGYDFNFWAWYTPDPKGWARGERWLRCDAMKVLNEKEPLKFKSWRGLVFKGKKLASTRT